MRTKLFSKLRRIAQRLYTWVYPFTCILCNGPSTQTRDLCQACESELPWLQDYCASCGLALVSDASLTCRYCLQNPPPYHHFITLYHYQAPVIQLIRGIKFHHKLAYSRLLSELLAERVYTYYQGHHIPVPECIIPMPLHTSRLRQRGFNQALLLAQCCAQRLKVAINTRACQRHRATQAQTAIPAKQRWHNVKNAFSVHASFNAKHVAIVDDVVTTGQTIHALSTALRQHGVTEIDIWCCARTQMHFDTQKRR